MVRQALRIISALLAIVASLLFFRSVSISQEQTPFGTEHQFETNMEMTNVPKSELVSGLDDLADSAGVTLVKVVTDPEDFEGGRDVIWFGSKRPPSEGVVVRGDRVRWFDASGRGELIHSSHMGTRPLGGLYAVSGSPDLEQKLDAWARGNGVAVTWQGESSASSRFFSYLTLNGLGNAVVAVALLLLAALISFFMTKARSRSLRLLGGVEAVRIHREDVATALRTVCSGLASGTLAISAYVAAFRGIDQLRLVAARMLAIMLAIALLVAAICLLVSLLTRPTVRLVALRQIPLKNFQRLGLALRALTIVVAMLVIPSTATYAINAHRLGEEHALWSAMEGVVRLSFGEGDEVLYTPEGTQKSEEFLRRAHEAGILRLSYVVDEGVGISPEEHGGFDHIVVADRAWADALGVGVGRHGSGGKLTPVDSHRLSKPLQSLLDGQISLWTRSETRGAVGLGYYTLEGGPLPALSPNVGLGGDTIQAENPLVILLDDPVAAMSVDGFLMPLATTGNLVFTDESRLRTILGETGIEPYVSSIDGIADLALGQAQKFLKEVGYYASAVVLALLAMVAAGAQSAHLWAGAHRRRIFTLHSNGHRYREIAWPALKPELVVVAATILAGSALSFFVRRPEALPLGATAIAVAALYSCSALASYRHFSHRAFIRTSHRQH